MPKFVDAKTLGMIIKIINGFTIPPVKYIRKPSWNISIVKKISADLSDNYSFFVYIYIDKDYLGFLII